MTDFSKANYDELDGFERGPVAGVFSRGALNCEQIGVSRFRYAPNSHASIGHRHRVQEEVYVITSGSGRMRLDDEVVDLRQWDVVRVAPAVVRAFEAGPDGLEYIAAGGNRPPDGDGEMIEGFWPDEG